MKSYKKIPTALFIIIPIILVSIFIYLFYLSSQKVYKDESQIRPLSELIEMDFLDVGNDTVEDLSKCNSARVLEQLRKDSTNQNLANNWIDYDPEIHKLIMLGNCWWEYENEYAKFIIRDLNDSLSMQGANNFWIIDSSSRSFSMLFPNKNGLSYNQALLDHVEYTGHVFIRTDSFINPNGVVIDRTETYSPQIMQEKQIFYTIDMPDRDKFIYLPSYSQRISKEILSTIEIK